MYILYNIIYWIKFDDVVHSYSKDLYIQRPVIEFMATFVASENAAYQIGEIMGIERALHKRSLVVWAKQITRCSICLNQQINKSNISRPFIQSSLSSSATISLILVVNYSTLQL